MCDRCIARRIATQNAIVEALAESMPTSEGANFVRTVINRSTAILDQKATMEEVNEEWHRLITDSSTEVVEDALDVFGTLEALGDLHRNATLRELARRYQQGDRAMSQHAQEALTTIAESDADDEDDGPMVVIVQGRQRPPFSRDTTGRPIMPPSKDVQ